MTEAEAKQVIREDPGGNIWKRIEAIFVAERALGEDCTVTDIMKWAEEEPCRELSSVTDAAER